MSPLGQSTGNNSILGLASGLAVEQGSTVVNPDPDLKAAPHNKGLRGSEIRRGSGRLFWQETSIRCGLHVHMVGNHVTRPSLWCQAEQGAGLWETGRW